MRSDGWQLGPMRRLVLVIAGLLVACSAPQRAGSSDASFDASYEASAPMGICNAVEQQHPIEGFTHVPECSTVAYLTKPPSSGNHYPVWAAYRQYTIVIPEGYWVHDLEHGAIVLSYNCDNYAAMTDAAASDSQAPDSGDAGDQGAADGGPLGQCAADIAAAQAMLDALPDDPECTSLGPTVKRRSVMTPDPKLDVPFAASAWGWTLRADCFDPTVFQAFALSHYGQGREDLCGDGEDLSSGIAPGCGN